MKNLKKFNEKLEESNLYDSPIFRSEEDESPVSEIKFKNRGHIKNLILQSINSGDLERLKELYKVLPENWENNYLMKELENWFKN